MATRKAAPAKEAPVVKEAPALKTATSAKGKVFKFPKSMALCADRYYELKAERSALQKVVDTIEEEEKAIKAWIIDNLPKSNATGAAGKIARATIVEKEIPQVEDWPAFYAYVAKTKSWDLMQKRLSDAAIKARFEDGKAVPGVKFFKTKSVSLNKV